MSSGNLRNFFDVRNAADLCISEHPKNLKNSLKSFFEAKKIAVIGASREEEKVGHIIFKNLVRNKYLKVFPVNPSAEEILGIKCFNDISEIPFEIDMVVIAVKAEFVPDILEQCGKKGVKSAIVISAGFSESGNRELEDKLKKISEDYGINILGPNVLGIINAYKDMNASFFNGMPEKGNISFISQSGALGTSILDIAIQNRIGFANFISLGNMMFNDFISALEYLENDPKTEVIMIYMESLKEDTGRKFIEVCQRISKVKKIIAVKAGKTEKGQEAARTHTSSLASDSKTYSGAFKQSGIIEASSIREMLALARIFSKYKNLGKKAMIITNAGGLGVLASDSLSDANISIPSIPEKLLEEFDKILPKGYSRNNPLDILGDALAERYEKVLLRIDKEGFFDFFVVIMSPQEMSQPVETAKVLSRLKKPVFPVFIGGKSFEEAKKLISEKEIISFDDVSDFGVFGKIN
ncbi:CoA-binding protein [Candidatus Pacearchaeota archaeon]|nr:CoA-binding protein [Candidatus Pacearchaeota archaeon]